MSIAFVIVALILSLAAYRKLGRLAGFLVTAFCAGSIAYFLMAPVHSFRISGMLDLLALTLYGISGMVFARTVPAAKSDPEPIPVPSWSRSFETEVSTAVASLLASGRHPGLQSVQFDYAAASLTLPCSLQETIHIVSEIVGAALTTPDVRRIAIRTAQLPRARQVIISANRVWPPPLDQVVTIGRRDADCEPVRFPGFPSNIRVSWFDNGYDRIYRVSIATS